MIQWIFPVRCLVCNQIVVPKGVMLHENCMEKLEFIIEPLCKKCGVPLPSEEQEYCEQCMVEDRGWDYGRSVFCYRGAVQRALHQVKQEGTREFVQFFALQMQRTQKEYIKEIMPDCLVPVPLHFSKLKKRGFNIDKKMIDIDNTLSSLGSHIVIINLHKKVRAELAVRLIEK